jgi:phage portal protein BeeE
MLNKRQADALIHAPDVDMSLEQGRSLLKSARRSQQIERKRTTPNVFTTLSGRPQPRQGFLSTEMLRAIYLRSELVRACVDTLIEFVTATPWTIKASDEDNTKWLKQRKPEAYLDQQKRIKWLKQFFKRPSNYENLELFHRRLLRDLLIFDAGSYEISTADYGGGVRLPVELGTVAGDTVEIETDYQGIPSRYWQSYNVLHNVPFELDELAYLMLNPCSWQPYGISPIETAWISIASDLNASKYNSDYFAKNAVPPALLAVMGVSDKEFRNVMAQLRNTSSDNPHNIHAFKAQRATDGRAQETFQLVPLSQVSNRDMQYAELIQMCVNRVCMLYRVTPSQIGFTDQMTGGIGSGVAETQDNLFQNKGVAPLLRILGATHTYYVVHGICGWTDLEFTFEESNTPQEQAEYQRSLSELQNGVTTINEHRSRWGGRSAVDWGDLPLSAPAGYQPPMTPQQLQQQAMQMGGGQPGQPQLPGQQPQPQLPGAQAEQPEQAMQKTAQKRIIINL